MSTRTKDPGGAAMARALEALRTAAYVLRDFDFASLDDLDERAIAEWEASLVDARGTLARALALRGGEELERPPRGQLEKFEISRVANHVKGISKALIGDLSRVDALPMGSEITTPLLLGLLYSARSVEQFARWLDPKDTRARLRARVLEGPRKGGQAPPAEPEPPPPEPVAAPPAEPDAEFEPAPADAEAAAEELGMQTVVESGSPDLPDDKQVQADVAAWIESMSQAGGTRLPEPEPAPLLPEPAPAPPPRATPPAVPRRLANRRDVDLSSYDERPDEYGGAFRWPPLAVHHGCSRGPELAKRGRALDATCLRSTTSGVAFAVADGSDASIGSRIAAVAATTAFCEHLAALKDETKDVPGAVLAAAEAARSRLDKLLGSLVESADDSDAFRRLRGSMPSDTIRRILEHTLEPDPGLKNVTPALAVSFAGGLVLRRGEETHELFLFAVGNMIAERKPRGQYTEVLLSPGNAAIRFGPGRALPWKPASAPVLGPVALKPGDVVVAGPAALRRGFEGPALEKLPLLSDDFLRLGATEDEHALQVLRQIGAAADRFDALEEKRGRTVRQPLFGDDLSIVLITLAARARTQTIPRIDAPATKEPGSSSRRAALSTISKLLKKPL